MTSGNNITFLNNLLRFTFLLVLFGSSNDFFAQTQSIPYFKNYPDNQGFPGSTVFSISDDREGYIWFCTDNGLYKFDGRNYFRYAHNVNDSTSIPEEVCLSVFLDSSDRLWVGCGSYLCLYNSTQDNFTRFELTDGTNVRFGITSIFEDSKQNIFCCSEPNALFYFSYSEKRAHKIDPIKDSSDEPIRIKTGFTDEDGTIWLATYGGIVRYSPENNQYKVFNEFQKSNHNNGKIGIVTSIVNHPKNKNLLLCGTWGNGLIAFDKTTGEIQSYLFQAKSPSNLNNIIFDIHLKGNEEIWIAASKIGTFHLDKKYFHFFENYENSPRQPIQSEVRCIHHDRSNLVWFGTVTGVCVTDLNNNALSYLKIGLKPKGITELLFDPIRRQYYSLNAYDDRCLRILDEEWNELDNIPIPEADQLLSEPFHAFLYQENTLWIGTTRQGILTFDLITRRFDKLRCRWPAEVDPNRIYTRSLCADQKGNVWMCSMEYGLLSFDPKTNAWKSENDKLTLPSEEGRKLVKVASDKENRIWCLNDNYGLLVIDVNNNSCSVYEDRAIEDFIILKNGNAAIAGLQSGPAILAFTDAGIELVKTCQQTKSVNSNRTLSVCEDHHSNLWFMHRNGVEKYSSDLKPISSFGASSGLLGNLIETELYYFDSKNLFIPFSNGIYTLSVDADENDYLFKPVRLTALTVKGESLTSKVSNEPIPFVQLAHYENFLSLQFNTLEFIVQDDLSYLYKLEGNDEEWRSSGTTPNVNYSDLPYGEYTFKVKVVSPNGKEGPEHTLIKITIQPAWWQTWFFRGSIIILLLLLVVSLVRYFSTRKLRRTLQQMELQRGVEKVRNRIARDIHDEIGSGLTKISLMSSRLEESELTLKIQNASKEIITNMAEIIWAVNPENDSLSNLTAHIRDVSGRFFEDSPIRIISTIPILEKSIGELTISPELKRNIMLTLKEAFTNILKHSEADTVKLRFAFESKKIYLTIEDNGKGIPKEIRMGGNGLKNMEKRTLESGGEFNLKSSGPGTCIELVYPVK